MSIEMPAQSLRTLLQDTMLHIALLTEGARISRVHDWRARCIALVKQFEQAMQDGGYRGGVANELGLAQCVLLDEITMRSLSSEQQDEWLRELLQFRFHSTRDGLSKVRARVDRLLKMHSANAELLEMYSLFYELGLLEDKKGIVLADDPASEAKPMFGKKTPGAGEVWIEGGVSHEAARGRSWRIVGSLLAFAALMTMWLVIDERLSHEVEQVGVTLADEATIHRESGD
ncbi:MULTISPECIES: DotU family type IV/VI secretion system protein [Burkholderia]|uniref:DotU family type IV/VI secretion system protein n=1 Tax=Burkholderia TaxID=32008 RepID=UPI000530C51D|nr:MULTISPECIES: DotU family type IV/VI secretion system protein [Burkholderia]AOJ72701.1 type VI secretion protein [Burkholderia savannae]KGS04186.1 hypothetical protein X946_569 [Burkholderia sp. ABCPW 111]KVG45066.1 type VI secretion protein [Burkholderia sp. MSMB0265]KVG90056.1 type VI secretion protein [Burkholderia sp. MSMB2040]KVG96195.1 type VI secretion protein [Burkholderia sp. MSMB2041]